MFKTIKRILVAVIAAALLATPALADTPPAETAAYHGVDIYHGTSENGQIDWAQLKSTQDFVYIKADEGENWVDPMYQANVAAAKSVGLAWGTYHFLRLYSVDSCRQQADNYWARIKGTGYSLIPAVDVESHDGQATASGMRDCIRAFVDEFQRISGITPVLYTYTSYANDILRGQFTDCPLWLADYRGYAGDVVGWGAWHAWQYSDRGDVAAIANREVDLDKATSGIFMSSAPVTTTSTASQTAVKAAAQPSEYVRGQQIGLNKLGITDNSGNALAEDGITGTCTIQAIERFQSIMGILSDGIWGPQTQAVYNTLWSRQTLQNGSTGYQVRYVQYRVGVTIDGQYGPVTAHYVGGWQYGHGLLGDGVVGPQTWQKMIG